MPRFRPRQIFSLCTAAALVVATIVLVWPPPRPGSAPPAPTAGAAGRGDLPAVKFVLRVAPGAQYFPGVVPQGVGAPLQGFHQVAAAFEAQFPDTRVELINTPVAREFLVTQLSGGSAPDIVAVNVEDVWVDVQKNWYVPLDRFLAAPNPFVVARGPAGAPGAREWWDMFRYQAITRGKEAPDGRNYCISLDMVETGIFYNKTFFAAHGLRPPQTWTEFMALLRRLRALGKTPLLANIDSLSDWAHDLLFDQLYYGLLPGIDLKKEGEREAYLQGYLDAEELTFLHTKGFFTRQDPRYLELWRLIDGLKPYLNRDLNTNTDLARSFLAQEGIMIWNGSWFTGRLTADKSIDFEWDVFYPPPLTRADSPYASGVPMCVIGGAGNQYEVTNSAVSDTDPALPLADRIDRSQRLPRVVAFLQFLTLPENAARVVNEFPGFIPNIVGAPALPMLQPFETILERRYTTTKWLFSFDLRFTDITRRMLQLELSGGCSLDEFIRWQTANVDTATTTFIHRHAPDFAPLERAWARLAPVRAHDRGLPPEARAPPAPSLSPPAP